MTPQSEEPDRENPWDFPQRILEWVVISFSRKEW